MKSFISSALNFSRSTGPIPAIPMTPAQERRFKVEGVRVVLGGALVHFVLGCFYLWGGISLYVASYLKENDPSIDIDLVKMVFPFMNLTLCFGMPFGVKIADRIGGKLLLLLSVIAIALLTFITSFINSFYVYLILYGLGVGMVSGLSYVVAYSCGWKYFPNNKGIVSGTVLAGYGFGSLTWNFVALACVNPENHKATVKVGKSSYFAEEVYQNVPYMMRILALCYLLVGILGVLLITTPKATPLKHQPVSNSQPQKAIQSNPEPVKDERKSSEIEEIELAKIKIDTEKVTLGEESPTGAKASSDPCMLAISVHRTSAESSGLAKEEPVKVIEPVRSECTSMKQGFKSLPFWLLLAMAFFGTFYGFLMANNYKVYGLFRLSDDNFVTTVGSIGSAANGCSRIFWATLLDKFGYKKVFSVLMVLQIIICGTLDSVSGVKVLFLIWYALTMFCEGGILAMEPAVTGKIFGAKYGSLIYGFVFFGMAMANLCSFFLTKFATNLEWADVYWICFAFSVVALIVNLFFNQYYKFSPPKSAQTAEKSQMESTAVKA